MSQKLCKIPHFFAPNYHAIYYSLRKSAYRDILGVTWTLPNGKLTELN